MPNSMKLLREAYERQYNRTAPQFTDITNDWSEFQLHYTAVRTEDLMYLLKSCFVFINMGGGDREKVLEDNDHHVYRVRNALKRELGTREHIPNKAERRAIRQDKANNGKI